MGECFSLNHYGISITNAENPKSSVIPHSVDCQDLSNPAVDPIVDSALQRLVFPESMCPRTPMLKLKVVVGSKVGSELSILGIVTLSIKNST